jgi:peptidoglycan/xylan/chitin deacetylase (PgdA/CDA1 family)
MRYIFFILISSLYLFANAHIFVYHRFDDGRYPSANTTPEQLTKQFEYFKSNGYKVVPLLDIVEKIKQHKKVPSNWIALTIDDAYKSFYKSGLGLFKKYNYPFTLYVYVKATDKHYGDYMNWQQIKEASKYGSIGLHSYAHPRLQTLTKEQIVNDTKKTFDIFTAKLNITPLSYAYPYGEYDNNVKQILKNNFDFTFILNQSTGSITTQTDLYDMPRIALVGKVNLKHKLRYKTFDVKWYEPLSFPKDGVLKRVYAKVDKKYKKLKLYITGEGWRDVKVKNGIVDVKLHIRLKRARTRVMLGSDVFTISNNIINKKLNNKGK